MDDGIGALRESTRVRYKEGHDFNRILRALDTTSVWQVFISIKQRRRINQ
jgi:hypothetical protein